MVGEACDRFLVEILKTVEYKSGEIEEPAGSDSESTSHSFFSLS